MEPLRSSFEFVRNISHRLSNSWAEADRDDKIFYVAGGVSAALAASGITMAVTGLVTKDFATACAGKDMILGSACALGVGNLTSHILEGYHHS